jgi:hypothetical protein
MADIICGDPLHPTRSGEPDYSAVLGDSANPPDTMRCGACIRLTPRIGGQQAEGTLAEAKLAKVDEIEQRTVELFTQGFEYPAASGDFYSLSPRGQLNLVAANSLRTDLTYPSVWTTIDNTGSISFSNAAEINTFAAAGVVAMRVILEAGNALKVTVEAAIDIDAVAAIVDTR